MNACVDHVVRVCVCYKLKEEFIEGQPCKSTAPWDDIVLVPALLEMK